MQSRQAELHEIGEEKDIFVGVGDFCEARKTESARVWENRNKVDRVQGLRRHSVLGMLIYL